MKNHLCAWMVAFAVCVNELMAQVSFDASIMSVVADYRLQEAQADERWCVLK
jgi:hypothetical protein